MAVVYALSEFTDEKGVDWLVKIVDGTISTGDLNHRFTLGPDGFRHTYDYDNFDRVKPILGSRVQFTLFHPDDNDAAFNTLYSNLDSAAEGTYRVEIYRDPDSANEAWWIGEILPEQTIIPDAYPHAPITITAVDGLANLKGIDYNNSGAAWTGTDFIVNHIYKALSKVHCANFWGGGDVLCAFMEDIISAEYQAHISSGQNQQLYNARVEHNSFYNKDSNGINQFFSAYDVLESVAMSFNACVFMAQGKYWFIPLGAIQGHASNKLDIYHEIRGGGVVSYNTSANVTFSAAFGNNSSDFEKLAGWERSSSPAFKEVLRNRDYQGGKPLLMDSHYTEANIVAGTVLSDEDVAYSTGMQILIQGNTFYSYDGDSSSTGADRIGRVKLSIKVKVGDAGGTVRYLKRDAGFPNALTQYQYFYDSYDSSSADGGFYAEAQYSGTSWNASDNDYELVSLEFDKKDGGHVWIPWQIATPALDADASGLQVSVTISGVDYEGNNDADLVDTSDADFNIYDLSARLYDNGNPQLIESADIKATNPDDARYNMDQGKTLIGDSITDADLGAIVVNNGSAYVSPSEWDSHFNTASNLGINALGVQERLAANADAVRIERGTLFRTGTKFIHPYTILTNTADSSNFYQLTGISFVAARCEYDIECMYLTRNATGITVAQDNVKGPVTTDNIVADSDPKGPAKGTIPAESTTKLLNVNTDDYGISGLKCTNGSSGTNTYVFPTALPTTGHRNLMMLRGDGAILNLASGSVGQVLTMHSGGTYPEWAAASGGESGWFNSTTLIKVMPTEFLGNDDHSRSWVVVEDDTTDKLGVRCMSTLIEVYLTKAIPTGYKATHVQVYASASTSSAVTVRQFNQTNGDLSGSTTGDFNSNIDITDITSSTTANIMIKLAPASTSTVIYGADITIAAV